MKKSLVLIASVLVFVVSSLPAMAGVKLELGDESFITLGYRLQMKFEQYDNGTNTTKKIDAKRNRIVLGGQISPLVKFFYQTDEASGGLRSDSGGGIETRDVWIQFDIADALKLQMGIFKVQMARHRNNGGYGFLVLDFSFIDGYQISTYGVNGKRDRQVAAWGNLGKFQYRLGVGEGARPDDYPANDPLRVAGRVHYAFWDAEKGFAYKGTNLGAKSVLTIGAGFDGQPKVGVDGNDYKAWTMDVMFDKPVGNGSAVTLSGSYYNYDQGANTSATDGAGWFVTGGYLFPGKVGVGKLQPYLRYASWNTDVAGSDQTRINAGFNYYLKGQKAKIVINYESIDHETGNDESKATMQWQIMF